MRTFGASCSAFEILPFDYANPGSASEDLAKERSGRALNPDEAAKAPSLWTHLVNHAQQIAVAGGERTRENLAQELGQASFRLAGEHRHTTARNALNEISRAALADIGDRVGDATLARAARLETVRLALYRGRYVEIRGDSGVGKSGLLKHFALEAAAESRIVVLSPGRTAPRWAAMRAELGFEGTARDLLADLANDGGSILFVDNVDFFGEQERTTVVDLLRAASETPGISVVATARRNFGSEEPSWLPEDAIDILGRGGPVDIGELDDAEIAELREAAPTLAPLLGERHPARQVARNLYRLARLSSRHVGAETPRTEMDMAEQWWRTADGAEQGRRDRKRVLTALAERALRTADSLDSRDLPAYAIDELIANESVRDLGGERISFRHDVLREWAIANLLIANPDAIERSSLQRPAPPAAARGVELAARFAIERAADSTAWTALLERFSADDVHGSWRRAVLLALVRSEIATDLLGRAAALLFADRAKLLRELIRTTMAVDSEPANDFLTAIGVDPKLIPKGIDVPSGPSWSRFISWLLSLGDGLPAAAIPDVVDLYSAWSRGMVGMDPLTPRSVSWLYRWLIELETAREGPFSERREPFGGAIDYNKRGDLETSLRTNFLLFCRRTPELAVEYVRHLLGQPHAEQIIYGIMKFRGTLAQAAPAELAELTAVALIPKKTRRRRDGYDLEGPFGFADDQFLPESPAQGPFLELLIQAPTEALALIRKLAHRAVAYYGGAGDPGADVIIIPFDAGNRAFPWAASYAWSRNGAHHYALTSALMALEAWAHKRIEAGEEFDKVLGDVLGPPGSPATFLMIGVDLILSHWPKSREAAVPFLACPELLCIDHERSQMDGMGIPNILGLQEPKGDATAESLRSRRSRRSSLADLIGRYAVDGPKILRDALTSKLTSASASLGTPGDDDTLADPAFMAVRALHLADPTNWHEATVQTADGATVEVRAYRSPDAEAQHLARLQTAAGGRMADSNLEVRISLALEDPSRSSPEFAAAAVEWAKRTAASITPEPERQEDYAVRSQRTAVATAAMIAMRDGADAFRAEQREWAEGLFADAFEPGTRLDGSQQTLRFNRTAISFAGMVHAMRGNVRQGDIRKLLEAATRKGSVGAPGLAATLQIVAGIDERLIRSLLRAAFAAARRTFREWDISEAEIAARAEARAERLRTVVDAEMDWIEGRADEPVWPEFPMNAPAVRRGIRLPGGPPEPAPEPRRRPEEIVDHQAAAAWIGSVQALFDAAPAPPWTIDLVRAYADWTAGANGAGLDRGVDLSNEPHEWNRAYFYLLARVLPQLSPGEVDALAIDPIRSFPNESFYDAAAVFLRDIDAMYFNDKGLSQEEAVRIRTRLAERLIDSSGWQWNARRKSSSIETHLGPAVATFFFNDYGIMQPPKTYLFQKAVDRLGVFLPLLDRLNADGPCLFVAVVALNLFEILPRAEHAPYVVAAAKQWVAAFPDDTDFWINHTVGERLCVLLEKLFTGPGKVTDAGLLMEVDAILAALVKVGIADARRLETALASGR